MTGLASEVGTANPTPFEPPPAVRMTVLMPMACPRTLIRGPPLFPGLMEASVWMNSSYGPAPIMRPIALTMPAVTVCSSPKGFPIAMTGSPTSTPEESPSGMTGSPVATIFKSATCVPASRPMIWATNSRPSASFTRISVALSTTWSLVTT